MVQLLLFIVELLSNNFEGTIAVFDFSFLLFSINEFSRTIT